MTKNKPSKRRSLLVKHRSHQRIVTGIFMILIVLVIVSGVAFYLLAQKRLAVEFYSAHSQIRSTMEMLLPWMLIVYVMGILVTFFLAIIYSRRLAGPMLRFERELKQLTAGDFTVNIQLRKHDEFRELADHLNTLAASCGALFKEIAESQNQIQAALQKLSPRIESLNDAELKAALEEITEADKRLNEILTRIKS